MSDFVLHVNGGELHVNAPADERLLWVLRNHLNLTGTKYGCGEGQCGACTVMINGEAVHSCQISVATAAPGNIVTVEGLEKNGKLNAVQQAFVDEGALQCGYCTSGMVVRATALLNDNPQPSHEDILTAMNGNICRCGTYPRILAAIERAAGSAKQGGGQ